MRCRPVTVPKRECLRMRTSLCDVESGEEWPLLGFALAEGRS